MDKIQELQLSKCPTGIQGLDEITDGGLPQGRPTLICGSAGCGKTLFGVEFLVRGATRYGEPGVLVTFEETASEIIQNVASLGWNLNQLMADGKILIDHVYIEPSEIEETGEYDLEALFLRLGYAIKKIGAKRVLLDTIEVLFSGLANANIVRAEIRRLFHWLKDEGVTAVITGERGDNTLTRQGLEEYVSDCVIKLDQKTFEDIATRTLQVVKYRGSRHSNNEYSCHRQGWNGKNNAGRLFCPSNLPERRTVFISRHRRIPPTNSPQFKLDWSGFSPLCRAGIIAI